MPLSDSNAPVPGLNAHRYPQKPLRQPGYLFEDVPKCSKDFNGSVIQKVTNRDHFKEAMGEMVLLCIEAMRRNNTAKTASKPLSLEYIADRVDVDDPCFGYLVRTNQGQLQAFVTVTTFTNWQKSFRWDSLHELAFFYDEDHHDHSPGPGDTANSGSDNSSVESFADNEQQRREQRREQRKVDSDGTLAKQLQSTVRLGDPHNEGIVWPRVAEISLLGSLGGCGRKLVQLVLEDLEYQKATGSANYDYVVLQATDNSIPFYESLGFIRVGAVSDDPNARRGHAAPPTSPTDGSPTVAAAPPKKQPRSKSESSSSSTDTDTTTPSRRRKHHPKQHHHTPTSRPPSPGSTTTTNSSVDSDGSCVATAVPLEASSPLKPDALALPSVDIVSSPLIVYEVAKGGERPDQIAKKNQVNVWDIIFLNKEIYKEITPSSKLKKGTILHIPAPSSSDKPEEERKPTKWFIAKENDTPRKIAKMYSIPCKDLVAGNLSRLPELQAASRLKAGTRVKVSNLHIEEDKSQPYCHWSFPDDDVAENGEPSYMMAFKLNRGGRKNNPSRPILKSLAVPISPYTPPPLLMPSEAERSPPLTRARQNTKDHRPTSSTKRKKVAGPKPPKLPPSGLDIFRDQQRQLCPQLREKTPANFKILTQRWFELSEDKRSRYNNIAKESKKRYDQEMEEYEVLHSLWEEENEKAAVKQVDTGLFSKVVKLREDALSGKDYTYWYVESFTFSEVSLFAFDPNVASVPLITAGLS